MPKMVFPSTVYSLLYKLLISAIGILINSINSSSSLGKELLIKFVAKYIYK